jgi:uncharacterized protein (TIGR00730 family)
MNDPGYKEDAEYVGSALAKLNHTIIYGGGSRGLMGVVTKAALDLGGNIKGFMMECFNQAKHYPQKDFEYLCLTIAERKQKMLLESDAYIALGGGFGTLDEILEAGIEQYMGGYMNPPTKLKPIILINRNELYSPLLDQLDKFIKEGSVKPEVKNLFHVVKDGKQAIELLNVLKDAPRLDATPLANIKKPKLSPG